ncbi:ATPdependent RNA helicase DBP5, putative [Acanthamoeba castellanii str. Neff]|uniref:RNA helicase n=1 Tax=Acanthamoeba castellanii (strain ATCC 30010 / Neff) TaxID=1257118 RepID=L8H357_ACACF|nr:ATPdependent RNA helicase DBP5, putative [Acanthamoeba castellanii str. Neff]ELR19667.1 ATPdependent RNA helicase DBP5, putative [Acanthamoeba castellanii str. Neff]
METPVATVPTTEASAAAPASDAAAQVPAPAAEPKKDWSDLAEEEDEEKTPIKISGLAPEDTDAKLVIDQSNPDSPLYSVGSFEDLKLRPELLQGVYAMGFNKPSKIQETALPLILGTYGQAQNLIAQSQSGTGKTAAFSLGMLSRVDESKKVTQCLCICPARELARQLFEVITEMGKFTNIKTFLAVKDVPKMSQGSFPYQIVVGTPGKITDLVKARVINMREIKIFVLDEADAMLDQQGLKDQTMRVHAMLPRQCQVLLFSATYDEEVTAFALKTVPQPRTTMRLEKSQLTVDKIAQFYLPCKTDENKFTILSDIYAYLTIGQSIIFCQRKDTAEMLARNMKAAGHTVSLLHGNLDTKERDAVIDEYRFGKTRVLITTNVLARGIDILQITLVINYDVPVDRTGRADYATYLHRIGRSGRFGRSGIALNFVSDQRSLNTLKDIERYFGKPIAEFPLDDLPKLDAMLRELS